MPSTISAGTTAGTAIAITGDTTGNLAFQTNGTTTAMTITTAQNVGIGTASPDRPLVVTSSSDAMTISQTGGGVGLQMSQSSVNDVLLRMTNSSGHYWDIRNQGSGSQFLIGGFFGDTLRLGTTGNLQFNSGYGSVATAYGCRAWVNFNGQGTPAIRASGNISSLTDNGTGNYYINFSTSMPDTNYSLSGATAWIAGVEPSGIVGQSNGTMETGRCGIVVLTNGSDATVDLPRVYAVIHR